MQGLSKGYIGIEQGEALKSMGFTTWLQKLISGGLCRNNGSHLLWSGFHLGFLRGSNNATSTCDGFRNVRSLSTQLYTNTEPAQCQQNLIHHGRPCAFIGLGL